MMDKFIESLDLTGFKRAPVDEAVALIYELLYQDAVPGRRRIKRNLRGGVMAADLYLHVLTPDVAPDVIEAWWSAGDPRLEKEERERAWDIVCETPECWIGEDEEGLDAITDLVPQLRPGNDYPVNDEAFTGKLIPVIRRFNSTGHPERFLELYRGERLFSVWW